jgi:hypothetical protein
MRIRVARRKHMSSRLYADAVARVGTSTDRIKDSLADYHKAIQVGDYAGAQLCAMDIENHAGQLALDSGVLGRYFADLRGVAV